MRRMIVLTGAVALLLTGCGEDAVFQPASPTTTALSACMSETQRQEIRDRIARTREVLGLSSYEFKPVDLGFRWPVQRADDFDDPGYHVISAFVDHDSRRNHVSDYVCGDRSYDDDSYNHDGTDIAVWPFGFDRMDGDDVEAIAAKAGTIVGKHDGEYDRNCEWTGADWNYVAVLHDDGKTTIYGHLKSGSVTSKEEGDAVSGGEYLGVVGSSGNSTGVHLHFEVWDENGGILDPFEDDDVETGDCNDTTSRSLWLFQKPYVDTALLKIMTGTAKPDPTGCDAESYADKFFAPGDSVYFSAYFRDFTTSDAAYFRILDPSGDEIWDDVLDSDDMDDSYYTKYWWRWPRKISSSAETGRWTFETEFEGETFQHHFWVLDSPIWLPAE